MKLTLDGLWASIVRTAVPAIIGAIMTWLVSMGIEMDPEFEPLLESLLFGALTSAYYIVVRLFEVHISPKFGWLLGYGKQPMIYAKPNDAGVPVITDVANTAPGTAVVEISTKSKH